MNTAPWSSLVERLVSDAPSVSATRRAFVSQSALPCIYGPSIVGKAFRVIRIADIMERFIWSKRPKI